MNITRLKKLSVTMGIALALCLGPSAKAAARPLGQQSHQGGQEQGEGNQSQGPEQHQSGDQGQVGEQDQRNQEGEGQVGERDERNQNEAKGAQEGRDEQEQANHDDRTEDARADAASPQNF
ncbi:MAG TPA: hypothetical protein VFA76_06595 [Terriglobales bacterium]|nr:hypothetical protein [Terriglobales bacterium]